jgi:hypothetical protein
MPSLKSVKLNDSHSHECNRGAARSATDAYNPDDHLTAGLTIPSSIIVRSFLEECRRQAVS